MANLTEARNTPQLIGEMRYTRLVASGATVYAGTLVAQTATSGTVVGASATSGTIVLGVAQNTASAGEKVEICGGRYIFDNGTSGEAITSAMIGSSAKVVDNHTVGCSGGTAGIVAGTILDVTSDGVVIQIH